MIAASCCGFPVVVLPGAQLAMVIKSSVRTGLSKGGSDFLVVGHFTVNSMTDFFRTFELSSR